MFITSRSPKVVGLASQVHGWCGVGVPRSAFWTTLVRHFIAHRSCCNVLGGGGDISSSTWDFLDTLVCEVKSSL